MHDVRLAPDALKWRNHPNIPNPGRAPESLSP